MRSPPFSKRELKGVVDWSFHVFSASLKLWRLPDLWYHYLGKTSRCSHVATCLSLHSTLSFCHQGLVNVPSSPVGGGSVSLCTDGATGEKCSWSVFLFLKENLRISDTFCIISSWWKKSVTHLRQKHILKGTEEKKYMNYDTFRYYCCLTSFLRNEWLKQKLFSYAPRCCWSEIGTGFVFVPRGLGMTQP